MWCKVIEIFYIYIKYKLVRYFSKFNSQLLEVICRVFPTKLLREITLLNF